MSFYLISYLFFLSSSFPFPDLPALIYRGNEIRLVLWDTRAREFEAEEILAASETGAIIAIFVGTLPKMYQANSLPYTLLGVLFPLSP